ncbi:hypothetical protein KIL84_010385 [Mauremys mutica]|uniref:Uncharacterized protein n=1 Tax=Mauremys mutica TaxID=74926 RepID=A0A9D4AZZ3_9SAUR|nr:hypothetical protein KIL84_010385 [Mauremys mutica]
MEKTSSQSPTLRGTCLWTNNLKVLLIAMPNTECLFQYLRFPCSGNIGTPGFSYCQQFLRAVATPWWRIKKVSCSSSSSSASAVIVQGDQNWQSIASHTLPPIQISLS